MYEMTERELDELRTEMALQERDERIKRLVDRGAVYYPDLEAYVLDDKVVDEGSL